MTTQQSITYARRHGITPSAFHCLLVLLEDSPLLPSRIARLTHTSAAAVTGVVDVLARDGWVVRTTIPGDRRKRPVVPTEKAFEVFAPMMREESAAI